MQKSRIRVQLSLARSSSSSFAPRQPASDSTYRAEGAKAANAMTKHFPEPPSSSLHLYIQQPASLISIEYTSLPTLAK